MRKEPWVRAMNRLSPMHGKAILQRFSIPNETPVSWALRYLANELRIYDLPIELNVWCTRLSEILDMSLSIILFFECG
jgi:hypothetical protein